MGDFKTCEVELKTLGEKLNEPNKDEGSKQQEVKNNQVAVRDGVADDRDKNLQHFSDRRRRRSVGIY